MPVPMPACGEGNDGGCDDGDDRDTKYNSTRSRDGSWVFVNLIVNISSVHFSCIPHLLFPRILEGLNFIYLVNRVTVSILIHLSFLPRSSVSSESN